MLRLFMVIPGAVDFAACIYVRDALEWSFCLLADEHDELFLLA